MPTSTLKSPRARQPDAHTTQKAPSLAPNEVATPTPTPLLMSWAEWAATPRDYRLEKGTQRWVLRAHPAGGVGLYPVHITG
jgi:hypothetical protein